MIRFFMGTTCLWIVTGLCFAQAAASAYLGNYPIALVVAAYAVVDLGLIWSMLIQFSPIEARD